MSTNPLVPVTPVAVSPEPRRRIAWEEAVAYAIIGALVLFALMQHLAAAVIVGLMLYRILDRLSERFRGRMSHGVVRPLALLIVTTATAAIVAAAVALIVTMLRRGAANVPEMMERMAEILGSVRLWLGGLGRQFIPEVMTDAEDFKAVIVAWLKTHAQTLRAGSVWLGIGLVHMIMGSLMAILVFFRHVTHHDSEDRGPLARHLVEKVGRFAEAFSQIAVAQVKISAVNTSLTGIYLLVVLPLFGIEIPFRTTLVVITFLCGLIPVLGNLISNTVITILSMGVSMGTAFASLAFLVVIHKLEYLINSRIVGGETDSQAWEILLAIIVGEAAFGVSGVVMAPIVYAFIKRELREHALV
ncbi:MAG: AI-2E family transporter [Acidobacteria bacterium]|nr:AI-2E family transporter [Acidobacteriota bacterium]MBV9478727.1 AI-2E family transporter [Acidobacteriota bacterium]